MNKVHSLRISQFELSLVLFLKTLTLLPHFPGQGAQLMNPSFPPKPSVKSILSIYQLIT